MPSSCSSFWLSSSLSTASEYCPRAFGVAGLNAPPALGLLLLLLGYAEKAGPPYP
jgi:hypothetical protein